ncbi:DUF4249 domain-containing protein [Pontibacter chitinilyticus]|uniref:DUF4249 domain-containing protein n=1 Tax=Pontibacter chitinilyticus TaxID=2674989 RepID=UPI00321B2C6D
MYMRRVLFLGLLLLVGCIDPINNKQNKPAKHLVVECSFTNEASLNYVRLSYSQPYPSPYNGFEENATVSISSTEGENYLFTYAKAGYYYPVGGSEARGMVGHTYTLNIAAGGKHYQSKPVMLRQPIPIDAIHFEVDEKTFAFKGDRLAQLLPGYNVLVDYQDPAEAGDFLRWSFSTEYEVLTQPEEFINPFNGLPAPKDCCSQCFLKEELQQLKVADDRLTNGRTVLNQNVLFIPFERYLGVKNKLKVYQHTITQEAYDYFRILVQQKENTGTVFDAPPAEVKGNIFNMNDAGEQVIGFFDVSGVSMKEITILRRDIDYPIIPFHFADDCQMLEGATKVMPPGW